MCVLRGGKAGRPGSREGSAADGDDLLCACEFYTHTRMPILPRCHPCTRLVEPCLLGNTRFGRNLVGGRSLRFCVSRPHPRLRLWVETQATRRRLAVVSAAGQAPQPKSRGTPGAPDHFSSFSYFPPMESGDRMECPFRNEAPNGRIRHTRLMTAVGLLWQ